MKKLMIMIAILIGFSTSANAITKSQACKEVEKMSVELIKFKQSGGTFKMAMDIMEPNFAGLSQKDKNYFVGVIAIGFETTLSPRSYGEAVYSNCLVHY